MFAGFVRWIGFLTVTVAIVGALALTGGFFWFAAKIADSEVTLNRNADGIVALTGAAARIPGGRAGGAAGPRLAATDRVRCRPCFPPPRRGGGAQRSRRGG